MYHIILASQSPRRKHILKEAGIDFESRVKDTPEDFPLDMPSREVPVYLAKKKAEAFRSELKPNELLITADTVVILGREVLNKPSDKEEAVKMLQKLSGKKHEVVTGVCMTTSTKQVYFSDLTNVYFSNLLESDIEHYVNTCKPFDKAGGYGIQEYIGYIGIEKIEGSYFNVMGLPVKELYEELIKINSH